MATTVYLVRHGECAANAASMNLPHEKDLITEKGKTQADLLGKHLQDVAFTRAYASTFSRAYETAAAILSNSKAANKPELELDARIRERELGEYENRPISDLFNDLFNAAKKDGVQMLEYEVAGGERVADLEERIANFLEDFIEKIRQSDEPQTILVVTHGVVMVRLLVKLRLWARDSARGLTLHNCPMEAAKIPIKNTGYHIFTVDAPKDKKETVIEFTKLHQENHLDPLKPKQSPALSKEMQEFTNTYKEICDVQCTNH